LSAKRLELLHEFLPTATIMAALINPAAASGEPVASELQAASHVLGLEVMLYMQAPNKISRRPSPRCLGYARPAS